MVSTFILYPNTDSVSTTIAGGLSDLCIWVPLWIIYPPSSETGALLCCYFLSLLIWSPWRLPMLGLQPLSFAVLTHAGPFRINHQTEYPTTGQLPHALCLAACGWIHFWGVPISADVSHLLIGPFLPCPLSWKTWPINTVKIQYITFNIKYSLSGKIPFCNFESLFTLQKGTVNIILDLKEPV